MATKSSNAVEPVRTDPQGGLANKYRPRSLARVIGQETVVTRLQGILKTGKYPNAMLFTGPSSAGKTTMVRAFVSDMFGGRSVEGLSDYAEINGAEARGIDDMRNVLRTSSFKPQHGPRRVIMIDEAQQITGAAEQAILKPLETPAPTTLFIIASMEPEKLHAAIKNRCTQFALKPYTLPDIEKYVKRIAKGESMDYVSQDVVTAVAQNSNGELRNAANLMEGLCQYVDGLEKRPKVLKASDVEKALESSESNDAMIASAALIGVYANKFRNVHRALLDTTDGFRMVKTLLYMNSFLLNQAVLRGESHKAVWYSKQNNDLKAGVASLGKIRKGSEIEAYAIVQHCLVELQLKAGSFLVNEATLISATMFDAIQRLKPLFDVNKEK